MGDVDNADGIQWTWLISSHHHHSCHWLDSILYYCVWFGIPDVVFHVQAEAVSSHFCFKDPLDVNLLAGRCCSKHVLGEFNGKNSF
ncbi:hypothetical protein GmHk_06G014889 [Glycine max]|nr:hypothetical protein GmHk_06G014889 [Glycine max]